MGYCLRQRCSLRRNCSERITIAYHLTEKENQLGNSEYLNTNTHTYMKGIVCTFSPARKSVGLLFHFAVCFDFGALQYFSTLICRSLAGATKCQVLATCICKVFFHALLFASCEIKVHKIHTSTH